jgi:hypothetical protein
MRVSPILTAFNAGELSPQLRGRIDLEKYAMGCDTLENFFCRAHGGIQRRPGSYFMEEVKTSAKATRVIPFQFNTTQAYILEFGNQYVRFYKDYERLEVSGAAYEIVSPYLEADLFEIQYAQDSDIMYLCHPDYPVYKLSRTDHTAWTLAAVDFIDGPYLDENETAITITPSATTGAGITLTASASLFEAGHVGAFFRIFEGSTWGYVKITYVTDATHATADVISTLGGIAAVATWCEGAWSIKNGYPSTVAFLEQRAVFAGSSGLPQTLWSSATGDYEDMTPGTLDDDPFVYTIADKAVNSIRWLANLSNLIIGTTGGEARLGQQDTSSPITPSNAKITFQSFLGSSPLPGMSVGNAILFWERRGHPDNYGEKLRELSYNITYDSYSGVDLTVLAEHVSKGGIVAHALQQYPYHILWCVRNDGELIGMTYERDQDVVGWHRHPMDNGIVESIAVIPGTNQDDLYMVVQRTINGTVKRFIEVFMDYDWGTDQAEAFFVDSGLSYYGEEKIITGATKANPVVITATSHGFSNGDHVKISGVVGMTELNGLEVVVTNQAANTFECYNPDGTTLNGLAFTTYSSGGIATEMAIALSGLDHLEGEEVDVLADGAAHPACTVASGEITLEWYCIEAHVGLHYDSLVKTMGLEGGSREGTSQGKQKRCHEVCLRFHQTLGGKVGPDEDHLDTIGFRTARDTYGNPPALFTGDKDQPFPCDWDSEVKVTVMQDQPLPMTILSIMPRFRSEDR